MAFAFLLGFLLISAPALAIGIGPARIEVKFEPNLNATYEVHVFNNEDKTVEVQPYVSGDLAKYITIDTGKLTIGPKESKIFNFKASLPVSLEPGKRDTRIGVVGLPPAGAMVGAVAGAEIQYWVYVDYPEEYISVDIMHSTPELNKQMTFEVKLFNPVNKSLSPSADLEISRSINGTDVTVERFDFGTVALVSGAEHTFNATWTPTEPGEYKLVPRAYYNGKTTRREMYFTLAAPSLPGMPPAQQGEESPQAAAPDLWHSPYTYLIILLIIAIIAVAFWPEKRRE